MATLSKGDLFSAALQKELFNKVKGHSSLAKLSGQEPIPFNGTKVFTFSLDKEVDIVAENGAKTIGGATVEPVSIAPIKIEYGARVSDEFMYASDEEAINILSAWADGFAKKVARGLDIMAIHGINPRTKAAATATIGQNYFDAKITNTAELGASDAADDVLDEAAQLVTGAEYLVTGVAMAPAFASKMAAIKANGMPVYPEFKFGQNPNTFAGMGSDVNNTVSFNSSDDLAIVGDFANAFKWGIAKEIPLKVIEYGNPDNDSVAGDLQGHNQVYLRSEVYIGWGILDAAAFAKVEQGE